MNQDILELTNRYCGRGIFVDANLLLLLFVGTADRKLIQAFKRTKQYTEEDYDMLTDYLKRFAMRVTTPNILTEVSNLAGALKDDYRDAFSSVFAKGIKLLSEHYVESRTITDTREFQKLGLSDSGIMLLAKGKYLLLTDDLRLAECYRAAGGDVINFNHIRELNW